MERCALFFINNLVKKITMKNKVNEIKISYIGGVKSHLWTKVSHSSDAAELLFENWDKGTIGLFETFKILLLNNSNKVKGEHIISQGGITGTLVDMRILFATVLKSLSVAIILAHNHPSGVAEPSQADERITERIITALKTVDIRVLDHLVVGNAETVSFAERGLI